MSRRSRADWCRGRSRPVGHEIPAGELMDDDDALVARLVLLMVDLDDTVQVLHAGAPVSRLSRRLLAWELAKAAWATWCSSFRPGP